MLFSLKWERTSLNATVLKMLGFEYNFTELQVFRRVGNSKIMGGLEHHMKLRV